MEPLPPVKEVEYRCIVGKLFDDLAGMEFITFSFETAKEFSNFRYEIAVQFRLRPAEGRLEFHVLGMTATRTMMPAYGTARSTLKVPGPQLPFGVYQVAMIKSDGVENIFTIELTRKGFQILAPVPRKRFIDLVIEPSAQLANAKITSTVSKTPPPPLVPRTIQKRQSLPNEEGEFQESAPPIDDEEQELFGTPSKSSKPAPEHSDKPAAKAAEPKAAAKASAKSTPKKTKPAATKKSARKPAPVKKAKAKKAPAKKTAKPKAAKASKKPKPAPSKKKNAKRK